MLIIAIILFGMIAGAAAQLLLGKPRGGIDWSLAFATGLAGSFAGGLLVSLLSGDGLELRPSGLIGSILGAVLVTAGWLSFKRRSARV
ncbi:MAG: GlsB/YeaQ/YmgE family stress response membrane protein [Nocardioides sp.]